MEYLSSKATLSIRDYKKKTSEAERLTVKLAPKTNKESLGRRKAKVGGKKKNIL